MADIKREGRELTRSKGNYYWKTSLLRYLVRKMTLIFVQILSTIAQ
jgi:hypothetical protein